MTKNVRVEPHLESYRSFFDHAWFGKWTEETTGTPLYQPVFDLGFMWRCSANTHLLPWLMATTIQQTIERKTNMAEPFGKKYVSAVQQRLAKRMGSSLRKTQRHRMQVELDKILREVSAVMAIPDLLPPETMWQSFLQNSEFQFALVGSQRLCYGAIYYAYEDFLTRCVGLAKGKTDYRLFRQKDFQKEIAAEFGSTVCDQCWDDPAVNLARVTRHALVHNGCRVTDEFKEAQKAAKRPLVVCDDEVQIMAPDTSSLFLLLKDRATLLISAALQHANIKGTPTA
jgi:hypothetical protein